MKSSTNPFRKPVKVPEPALLVKPIGRIIQRTWIPERIWEAPSGRPGNVFRKFPRCPTGTLKAPPRELKIMMIERSRGVKRKNPDIELPEPLESISSESP